MKRIFAVLFAALLLFTGCAAPARETEPEPTVTLVNTVDELLAAIAPGAVIQLGEGEFCLSQASDYGERKGPYYIWQDLGLGQYALQLQYLEGLTILGSGRDKTTLTTDPRFAHVLSFSDCRDVFLSGLTIGHTVRTEACEGGVVYLDHSSNVTLTDLGLYGCGTTGLHTFECENVTMDACELYDCSYSAVSISGSRNVSLKNSTVHSLGGDLPVPSCFNFWGECSGVSIENCTVRDNYVNNLITSSSAGFVKFRDNVFTGNRVSAAAFSFDSQNVLFENNDFEGNDCRTWYSSWSARAIGPDGKEVLFQNAPAAPVEPGTAEPVTNGEQTEVKVRTADQFLDAIGSNRKIILDAELIDLSAAKNYGISSDTYYWEDNYDGPSLVIRGVENLTIEGGEDRTARTICAVPRYAQVLTFEDCSAVTLSGFTAGHTVEPGYCMGGVLLYRRCEDILVDNCGLYGCGVVGVQTDSCRNLQIINSEIYECSDGGLWLYNTDGVRIAGTTFRDLGGDTYYLYNCSNVTVEGQSLDGNYSGS